MRSEPNDAIPIISIDAKKKELVGRFKNPGATWKQAPEEVFDHDFPSWASGKAVPYGIYDLRANLGWVGLGLSCLATIRIAGILILSLATLLVVFWFISQGLSHIQPSRNG